MRRFLSVGMAAIASILLVLILVFSAIGLVINNATFVNNEFTKLSISTQMGISNADLVNAFNQLVDYMEGDADSIDVEVTIDGEKTLMFDYPQEATHMQDVRQIYLTIASYRDVGVLVMLILFLFAAVIHLRKAPQYLSQGYLSGSFVLLLIFGFLGTWASLDFSSFWTFFHEMLFWNDLWLFDGTQSRMINMLPEDFFADIIAQVALYAGAVIVALMALSITALVLSSAGHKRRSAALVARRKAHADATVARKKSRAEAKASLEEARRLAEKRARIAAIKARKLAEAEEEAEAEAELERERLIQERLKQRRAAQAAQATQSAQSARTEPFARQKTTSAQQTRTKAAPAAAQEKTKKKRSQSIADDTGFLDD